MIERYDKYNWHDNAIHGLRIVEGGDGCSGDLDLDIDFIDEWLPPKGGECTAFSYRISPSNLVFHEVTNLVISLNYAACSASLQPMTIQEIRRKVFIYPNGYSSFTWEIEIANPSNSFISFHSPNFTQAARAAPIHSEGQHLTPSERS